LVLATGPLREKVWNGRPLPAGLFRSRCHIPGGLLNEGAYRVELLVIENGVSLRFRLRTRSDLFWLTRKYGLGAGMEIGPGVVRPDLDWDYGVQAQVCDSEDLPPVQFLPL